jgi:hypothetical protein
VPVAARADTYHAAPTARGSGDCSKAANACAFQTALDLVTARSGNDTIKLATGTYARPVLSHQFPVRSYTTITSDKRASPVVHGFDVKGGAYWQITNLATDARTDVYAGATAVTFSGITCSFAAVNDHNPCFELGGDQGTTITRSTMTGAFDGVRFQAEINTNGSEATWSRNAVISENTISGVYEDDIHVDGAVAPQIIRNTLRNPDTNTDYHHDGVEVEAMDGGEIARNRIDGTGWFGSPIGENNGIVLSRSCDSGGDNTCEGWLVANVQVYDNAISNWGQQLTNNGIVLDGASHVDVYSNTVWDMPNLDGVHFAARLPDVQDRVYNNILGNMDVDPGAVPPTVCSNNVFLHTPVAVCSAATNLVTALDPFASHATFALAPGSPAIGYGTRSYLLPRVDIDGDARTKSSVDVGCQVH